jgi:multidrug efflux system membrane fusion protein
MKTRNYLVLPFLALAAVVIAACTSGEADDAPTAPPAPQVTTAAVLIADLRQWADFTGRLEAVESVEVRARVGGYIEAVHFEEGGRVAQGDLLLSIDPRPFQAEVDRLRAERERAAATRVLARSNHARAERLFAQNATSREEVETFAAEAAVAEAQLAAVRAALDAAELNLSFTHVTAPISGRVSRAVVTAGNLVDSSTLLTTLVSDDEIYAYFDADEQTYLNHVANAARGDEASVYVGLINEEGYPHAARLDFVDNHVDPNHGTIRARAVLDNSDGRFTPGLFARLKLVSPNHYRAALVDDRAIGTDLGHKFVLVVDEQNVVQYRAVQTGRVVEGLRIVTSGLEAGDIVIVNGMQRVRPGATVAATQVAMDGNSSSLARYAVEDGRVARDLRREY